ncbi:hypothetical protein ACTFIY_005577 [Dictyostelium cf. discoideum]
MNTNTTPNYINTIEAKHIYEKLMELFKIQRLKHKYTKDNIQTKSVTIHPHFTVWLCALELHGVGGQTMKENAMDEVFGANKEGNHSLLALTTFRQLGRYNIES